MEFDKTMSFNFEKEKNTKTKEILNEFKENNERIKKKILIAEHDKSIGNND